MDHVPRAMRYHVWILIDNHVLSCARTFDIMALIPQTPDGDEQNAQSQPRIILHALRDRKGGTV